MVEDPQKDTSTRPNDKLTCLRRGWRKSLCPPETLLARPALSTAAKPQVRC